MAADPVPFAINRFSVITVGLLLASSGWADDPAQIYRAGQIIEEVLPTEHPDEPAPVLATGQKNPEHRVWATQVLELRVTPKQRDTIKACVQIFCQQKKLPPSPYLLKLLDALGLAPEG